VLDVLARGLAQRGHDVVLFTTGDSTCDVERAWLFETADSDLIGTTLVELRHTAAAYEALAECDIIHDHTLAGLFIAQLHPHLPVVTTNHGPFNHHLADLYRRTAPNVPIIAISRDQAQRAPDDVRVATVIHHGLDLGRYTVGHDADDYLLSLGRMNPDKGIDRAIVVARRAGLPLVIAAKMREPAEKQYFEHVIQPLLGGGITYVGEVGHAEKVELLQSARALINPIRWPEPFGLVMIESMACGTPVIATPQGAAPEIVTPGTGQVASSTFGLVEAVRTIGELNRPHCRRHAEAEFSMERMTRDHEAFYHAAIARHAEQLPHRPLPTTDDLVSTDADGPSPDLATSRR
jgi:glycosyltransferase involved in cell wall biosynthesis